MKTCFCFKLSLVLLLTAMVFTACPEAPEDSTEYSITIGSAANGSVTASDSPPPNTLSVAKAAAKTRIFLTIEPDAGYRLKTISVTKASGDPVNLVGITNLRTFTMLGEAVTVTAEFELIPVFNISIDPTIIGGTITAPATAEEGTRTTLTIAPASGSRLNTFSMTGATSGNPVGFSGGTGTTREFTMPGEDVFVTVTFVVVQFVTIDDFETNPGFYMWNDGDNTALRIDRVTDFVHDGVGAARIQCPGTWWWRCGRNDFSPSRDISGYSKITLWARSSNASYTVNLHFEQTVNGTYPSLVWPIGPFEAANEWQKFELRFDEATQTQVFDLTNVQRWYIRGAGGYTGQIWLDTIIAEEDE